MANNAKRPCKRKRAGENGTEEIKKKAAKIQNRTTVESDIGQSSQIHPKRVPVFTINPESNPCAITYEQLYGLINYAVLGKVRSSLPSWCQVHNQKELKGVAVIILHGVSQMHFYRYYLQFKHLKKRFRFRFSLPPPPDDFLLRIFGTEKLLPQDKSPVVNGSSAVNGHCLMTENNNCKSSDVDNHPIIIKYGRNKQGLTSFLLTEDELMKNDYPVAGTPHSEGFIQSGCTAKVTDNSPLLGLDCEMCLTTKGNELTRVSVVNADGCCVMDELVKPDNPILNYLTRFSGITKKMLMPVETKLRDVQAKLKKLLPNDAVLVGHSLNNDLKALKMIHSNIIDTSLLYARDFGQRFKLKVLARSVLGKEIQSEGVIGHDATEDARAAVELAQYFIKQGPMKVAKLNLENFQTKQPTGDHFTTWPEGRNLTNRLSDSLKANCNEVDRLIGRPPLHCGSLVNTLCAHDQKAVLLGTNKAMKELIHQEAWHKIECKTDKEVVQQAQNEIPFASLSLSHFTSYSEYSEYNLHTKNHQGLLHEKMRQKLSEMCTVYAGPFCKDFCLTSVERAFQNCGSISSISVITETHKPYVRIEYALPESALLAVLTLNGSVVGQFPITVQRPTKESTLDCDHVLKKLEYDVTNRAVIYVSGIPQTLTKTRLNKKFSKFGHIEAIIYPGDDIGAKSQDCFIKYGSLESAVKAQAAMNGQEVRNQKLNVIRALTPYHLQSWAAQKSYTALNPRKSDSLPFDGHSFEKRKDKLSQCEQELKSMMSTIDRRTGRLFRALPNNTLCMVLLPGTNSAQCSAPGLCLLEIKQDP
ncbi:RNA exonuclease 5-like [Chiloscyllium plagiosum]|uniref:RNA exonuclease 5-like n=1 Tax=Chiloscyllium plagiosum TaxID=36176 RepID=UPI001CB85653|nr:RNA exonuclease 5-like [Chiloscyllium plagiosum]XP_043567864.1 RNA exonuclease 5-like [Chiloscyllium plagiosum]XP_043567865.1 RNA exonuclease 5-like [Chiloscyllium plagiosum]